MPRRSGYYAVLLRRHTVVHSSDRQFMLHDDFFLNWRFIGCHGLDLYSFSFLFLDDGLPVTFSTL